MAVDGGQSAGVIFKTVAAPNYWYSITGDDATTLLTGLNDSRYRYWSVSNSSHADRSWNAFHDVRLPNGAVSIMRCPLAFAAHTDESVVWSKVERSPASSLHQKRLRIFTGRGGDGHHGHAFASAGRHGCGDLGVADECECGGITGTEGQ